MADYPHCLVTVQGRTAKCVFPPFVSQGCLDQLWEEFEPKADDVFVCAYPKSGTTWVEQGKNQSAASSSPYIVYVVRNPKDVAVSFYYHSCSKLNYQGSWDEFFELFISGQVGYGDIFDHVIEWWRASQASENRILVVSYEQLHGNLRESVQRIAEFLDIDASSDLIDKVVDQSTFETMSQNPKANLSWVPQRAGIPTHMRKGKVGDWERVFSPKQKERMEKMIEERLGDDEFSGLRDILRAPAA